MTDELMEAEGPEAGRVSLSSQTGEVLLSTKHDVESSSVLTKEGGDSARVESISVGTVLVSDDSRTGLR